MKPIQDNCGSSERKIYLFRKGEPFPGCAFFRDLDDAMNYRDCSCLTYEDRERGARPFVLRSVWEDEIFYPGSNNCQNNLIYGLVFPDSRFDDFFRQNGAGWVLRDEHKGKGIELQAVSIGNEDTIRELLSSRVTLIKLIANLRSQFL